jgi:hypothetical protein
MDIIGVHDIVGCSNHAF